MQTDTPWCIAHRGARDEAPENTITAFRRALAYPIDGIEFDVQLSADGVPVLYHDDTLAMVGGGDKQVSQLAESELEWFDWGGWFHPNFSGEALPTLEDAFKMLPRCPRMLVEIKTQPAMFGRMRDSSKRCGFLCDGDRSGVFLMDCVVNQT